MVQLATTLTSWVQTSETRLERWSRTTSPPARLQVHRQSRLRLTSWGTVLRRGDGVRHHSAAILATGRRLGRKGQYQRRLAWRTQRLGSRLAGRRQAGQY